MSQNQRQTYRCPVPEEFGRIKIQFGRKTWPGALVDESAGGVSFTTAAKTGLQPGQTVTLRTPSGSYIVEVVRVRVEEAELHVGARRLRDVEPEAASVASRYWLDPGRQASPHSLQNLLMFAFYLGLAGLTVAFLLGAFGEVDVWRYLRSF